MSVTSLALQLNKIVFKSLIMSCIRWSLSFFFKDLDMRYEPTDTAAMARTSNLNEELGQVNQTPCWYAELEVRFGVISAVCDNFRWTDSSWFSIFWMIGINKYMLVPNCQFSFLVNEHYLMHILFSG